MILITKSWRLLLVGVLLSLWASNTFCLGNQTVTQSFDIESVCGVFLPLVTASGPSLTAQVNQPYGLAFTKSGLLVSDASNYVIRLIQGGQISTPIGNGEQSDKIPKGPLISSHHTGYLSNPTIVPTVASASSIGSPAGVAVDRASGSVYFSDKWYQTVRKAHSNGTLVTFAGSGAAGYSGDGGPAIEARVYNPKGIAVDTLGNVFISDSPNHLVRAVLTNGTIVRVAGSISKSCGDDYDYYGNSGNTNACNSGYAGDGGLAVDALLNTPVGLSFDSQGSLFISDSLNHVIRKVVNPLRLDGSRISTIAGTGVGGHSGDGGLATKAALNESYGIAIDSKDNLYIAERSSHVIRKVSLSSGIITTYAGTPGKYGARGDGGPATSALLNYPHYVAVDDQSGDVFISDTGNNVIRKVFSSDMTIIQITRLYTAPNSNKERADRFVLLLPKAAVSDASGNIYVTDINLNGVFQVTASSRVMTRIAGLAKDQSATGDGGPVSLSTVGQPTTLAINSAGDLFFIDQINNIVRCIFSSNGTINTVAGTGTRGNSGDGPATKTSLNLDTGLALDESSGSLYLSDTLNHVVRRLDLSTGMLNIVAGVLDNPGFVGDGGPALNASLNFPTDLAFVPSSAPGGSRLCILDGQNFRIRALLISRKILVTVAGNGTSAYPGEGVIARNSSLNPHALASSPNGDLFIGSPGRIMTLVESSSRLFTIAGDGVPGFSGDDGPALNGRINQPNALSFDSLTGSLLVTDKGSRVVRRILPSRNPPPPPALRAPPLPMTTQRPRSSPNKARTGETMEGFADDPPPMTDLKMAQSLYSKTAILALTLVLGTCLFIGVLSLVVLGVIASLRHGHDKQMHRVHNIKIDCLVGTVLDAVHLSDDSLTVVIERDRNALVQAGDNICCFDEDFQVTEKEMTEANENGIPIVRHRVRQMAVKKIERVEPDEIHPTGTHQLILCPPARPFSWTRSILIFFKGWVRADEHRDLELPQVHRSWMGDATKTGAAIWKLPDTQLAATTKALQAGTVSFINPRLLMFEYRGLLAISVFCLYVIGLAFVSITLQTQSCEKVCTTAFVQFVQVNDESVCNAIYLSDPIPGFDLSVPGLRSEVNLGKCSILHSQPCANDDWKELLQCHQSLSEWIIAYARYLQINDWVSFGPEASRIFQTYNPLFNCSINTTIAYDGDCGVFSSTGNVCWTFEVSTRNEIQTGNGNCKDSKSKQRCAHSSLKGIVFESQVYEDKESIMCLSESFGGQISVPSITSLGSDLTSAFNISDGTLCGGDISRSNIGASCLTIRYTACQWVDGGSYFCLESTSSASDAEFSFPGLLFGPLVLSDMTSGFFRDPVTQTCSPWPPQLPLDLNGGSIFLSPLVERLFVHLQRNFNTTKFSSFILNSTIKIAYAVSDGTPRVDIGPSALGAFWARNLIYCCTDLCHPIASAVGEAFGYVDKFETIFVMLVIAGYLLMFREEARRLRLAFAHIFEFALGDKADDKAGIRSNHGSLTASRNPSFTRQRSVTRPARSAARMRALSTTGPLHSGTMRSISSTELCEVDKRRLAIMEEKIDEAVCEIKELIHEIKKVEREQAEAKGRGDQEEVSRLATKESQLREKEYQLREDLLEEKRTLRAERDRALVAAAKAAVIATSPTFGPHSELKNSLRTPSNLIVGGSGASGSSLSNTMLHTRLHKTSGTLKSLKLSKTSGLGSGQISSHRSAAMLFPEEPLAVDEGDGTGTEARVRPSSSPSQDLFRPASHGRGLDPIPSMSRYEQVVLEEDKSLSKRNPAYDGIEEGEREGAKGAGDPGPGPGPGPGPTRSKVSFSADIIK